MDYNLLVKNIRAIVIKKHLYCIKQDKCVCFTCGNASKFLRKIGLNVISVGNKEGLIPARWFSFTDIQNSFNNMFDATSGHLPMPLMDNISLQLRKKLKNKFEKDKKYWIKVGSGETIICLKMAFPHIKFIPYRIKDFAPTEYNANAPLNNLLYAIFGDVNILREKVISLNYIPSKYP